MPWIDVTVPEPLTTTPMLSLPAVPDTNSCIGAGAAVDGVDAVADGVEDRVVAAAGMNDVVAAAGQEQVDAIGAGDVVDGGRAWLNTVPSA